MPPIDDPLDDGLEEGTETPAAKPEAEPVARKPRAKKEAAATPTVDELQAELEAARKQLAEKSEELARNQAATANALSALSSHQPVPTGRKNSHGEDLYRYHIDLAPNGGMSIKINGIDYFHGVEYELTKNQLASVMDIVQRTWFHEQSIKGKNDNFYRHQTNRTLRGATH